MVVTRARRAVRAAVQTLSAPPPGLPGWASTPITDEHRALVDAFAAATDWPERQAALDGGRAVLGTAEFRAALHALTDLHPDTSALANLVGLLAEVDTHGLDAVLARHRDDHDRRALLDAWIATPWSASRQFLTTHRDALLAPEVRDLLTAADTDTAGQHAAILDLLTQLPVDDVHALITDPGRAEDAARTALEAGDLALLHAVLTAAPGLDQRPVTRRIATAVLLLDRDPKHAHHLARAAAAAATPIQRRAHASRLRDLAAHRPDLTGVPELIDILIADPPPVEPAPPV